MGVSNRFPSTKEGHIMSVLARFFEFLFQNSALMIGWEDYCEVYPSYSNGEKDRCVCRSSRENGVHNGLDKRKQAVKMVECTGLRRSGEPFSRGSVNTETLHQNRVTQSVRIF